MAKTDKPTKSSAVPTKGASVSKLVRADTVRLSDEQRGMLDVIVAKIIGRPNAKAKAHCG
jgi:hypothetical protein